MFGQVVEFEYEDKNIVTGEVETVKKKGLVLAWTDEYYVVTDITEDRKEFSTKHSSKKVVRLDLKGHSYNSGSNGSVTIPTFFVPREIVNRVK